MKADGKLVSIVVPCFNEEEVIRETIARLQQLALSCSDYDFEFLFVDDGSHDDTLAHLRDASAQDPRIRAIVFSRNFGHQLAVTAGIDEAAGDAVVLIDAVVRLLPSALGSETSAVNDSFSSGLLDYPHYTRPAEFRGMRVPDVLLNGNHAEIEKWRRQKALEKTLKFRKDLLDKE